jgi:hypothetical protein
LGGGSSVWLLVAWLKGSSDGISSLSIPWKGLAFLAAFLLEAKLSAWHFSRNYINNVTVHNEASLWKVTGVYIQSSAVFSIHHCDWVVPLVSGWQVRRNLKFSVSVHVLVIFFEGQSRIWSEQIVFMHVDGHSLYFTRHLKVDSSC